MRRGSLWLCVLTGVIALAFVSPAAAQDAPAAAKTPPPNSSVVSDPDYIRLAGYFRVGGGYLNGHIRRDSTTLEGTQTSLENDLDLTSPELIGQLGLVLRIVDDWRLFASFRSGAWDGDHVQGTGTASSPAPQSFALDGVLFSGESISSELTLLHFDLGARTVLHEWAAGRLDFGFGLGYWMSDLEVESNTTLGKRAVETTESGAPWAGVQVVLSDLGMVELHAGGRAGFLWYGDSVAYTVNVMLNFWVGVGFDLGPFLVTARVEYHLWETHQREHSLWETFGATTIAPTLGLTLRF